MKFPERTLKLVLQKKIRQNEGGNPLDNKDEDNIFESGHIINIDDRLNCV